MLVSCSQSSCVVPNSRMNAVGFQSLWLGVVRSWSTALQNRNSILESWVLSGLGAACSLSIYYRLENRNSIVELWPLLCWKLAIPFL